MKIRKERENTTLIADGEELIFDAKGECEVPEITKEIQMLIDAKYVKEVGETEDETSNG